jgi:hypothetical protein
MQTKQKEQILAVYLIFFLSWAGASHAAEIDHFGHPVKSTPYDQKNALAEVLNRSYHPRANSPAEPMDPLFWKARRFVYIEEKNGDDWRSPRETEKRQAGDCADKALWLYARLRGAGYRNLRLVVGKYQSLDARYHVWLMYTDENGKTLILDPTLQNRIWPMNAFQPGFYRPLFSFDGKDQALCFLRSPLNL